MNLYCSLLITYHNLVGVVPGSFVLDLELDEVLLVAVYRTVLGVLFAVFQHRSRSFFRL
jgi:hypothetical protein